MSGAVNSPPEDKQSNTETPAVPEPPSFKVYNPPRTAATSPRDLPDDYFTPSAADLKLAQAALHSRTQALVNAPFQTRALREQTEKAKRERWPTTTIRVRFTDRTQLEKVYPSTDKIRSVYAFVRGSLREDVKPIKFILYQSPPKRDLKVSDPNVRDLTLAELQLSPSSVLLLRFEDESMNHSDYPAPLAPSVLEQAVDLPTPPDFDASPQTKSQSQAQSQKQSHTSSASSQPAQSSGERKIPKWLKLGPTKVYHKWDLKLIGSQVAG
ncbi:hypothetical protein HETIRDRAFT_426413 [Heterobasidion irregulare TC 32-1]|uniref:UBX domain-containing protein n=1 Tax=Heterobasidion irregulare (strain TC 32-1) TaxID=747525 RepID=W4KD08_HETIT|nr:uncharacterized protein HETIRDRAFT_426413 [Heterobasidion irregulare TC 32-1]ETW82956.1 hypothetical protein HETIRDRAFT_426413 [Heterobasidion irregulare TC 32-1]